MDKKTNPVSTCMHCVTANATTSSVGRSVVGKEHTKSINVDTKLLLAVG